MKEIIILTLLVISAYMPLRVKAQSQEAVQLVLNYEKLQQLEEILDNMYKGYN